MTSRSFATEQRQDIFKQIADQFPAKMPPDDYQYEFIFQVKLDFRDWREVLKAIQAAPVSERQRVLFGDDPYCPSCGHNRDTSSVSSIDIEERKP